ncbi:hypothetical protein EWM64_g8491 [Hericium alpestre]|uniref:Nephrocystin 3-like N-terminal domain-containing protein n=1 Tax=Hericium alpestre TaxID=135208 RepID=A0A4Y9ZNV4_9AGAM|nr:hypothetical protein EWM64_g8491 [Hericium alpestre]
MSRSGALGGILAIKDVLEKVSANADDINALTDYMEKLNSMVDMSMSDDYKSCPQALQTRIEDLRRDVDAISKDIINLRSQNRITHIFTTKATSGKIQEHLRALMWAIHKFIVGGTLEIEMAVDELHAAIQDGFGHMDIRFDGLGQQVQNLEKRIELGDDYVPIPRYARSARFDSNSNRIVCEETTRLETLATVYHWIKPGDSRLADLPTDLVQQPTERRVLWLDGPAGTGKSTIAQTTAEWCEAVGYLGASFFCARDSNECSNVQLVFPTIAYQLGLYSVDFRDRVADVLRADPDIQNTSASRQLQKLIAEPLRAVNSSGAFPACAVIIDALDECKDDQAMSVILKALAHYVGDLDPLKIFITSRPLQHITGGFGMTELKDNTQHLAMNNISPGIVTRDITQYLQKQLAAVAHCYDIRSSWPSDDEMAALVHQANRLFIFAATAVKFVQDLRYSDPEAQLKALLRSRLPTSTTSPYRFLDALYTEVLHTAFPEIDRALKARLKMVLGSIVLVRDRLSPLSLEVLLGLERDTVRKTLRQLHSLVIVPEDDNDTIRLIHPSFQDFLTDGLRCKDLNFGIHPKIQHSILAQHCLRTLQDLQRDICEIGDLSKLNDESACKHWAFHLGNAEISEDIHELLKVFVAEHLLHWLEALSLLGDIGVAIEGLPVVRRTLRGLPLPASNILSLLYDCERIARQFYPCLSVSCLQVYFGIIPFCPTNIGLRKQYEHEVVSMHSLCMRVN